MLGDLQIVFIILVIAVLAPKASIADLILTSWYRDAARNELVGGVPGSYHTLGTAIDIDINTGIAANIFTLLQASRQLAEDIAFAWRSFGTGFQAQVESDHLHLELDLRALGIV